MRLFRPGLTPYTNLQGRSLEEVDELFEARLHAWQFSKYETSGTGRLLAALENGGEVADKSHTAEIEERDDRGEPKAPDALSGEL